ncbi:hypothetical protein FHS89_002342 [Rubricella aquisinus]|uniref:Uncharacterized protein n=1 Tax=Rubricella aquisinus TaxID=2028108 RepID=A0A840X3B3_9RHOB|nr:hypothetical protein [Rubricella aquisinus]MBB5516316.1 hypothetical protein [Rubricella aquisinus]
MNTLTFRFFAVVLVSITLAFAISVSLNYFKFRQTITILVAERIDFMASDLAASIQLGLDLGLELQAIENVRSQLDRAGLLDPGIRAIWVVDGQGATVFGAAPDLAEPLPSLDTLDGNWVRADDGALTVVSPLRNNFGLTVGAVAMRYSTERTEAQASAMLRDLMQSALVILPIILIPAILLVFLVQRRTSRRLHTLQGRFEGAHPEPDPDDDLGRMAEDVLARAQPKGQP